jgi:hypothetical protein
VSYLAPAILFVAAGFAKAIMDLSADGKLSLSPSTYWLKSLSSDNKYKNGDPRQGPAFFLSTTALVFLTDGWHLMQSVFLTTLFMAIRFSPTLLTSCLGFVLFHLVFELFYRILKA